MKISLQRSLLCILLLLACILAFPLCRRVLFTSNPAANESIISVTNAAETLDMPISSNTAGSESSIGDENIPDSARVDVAYISQYPELPTGCEITSLTEVLNFYGYDIDKEYMAEKYLPMRQTMDDGCFSHFFLGSPWDPNGSGCFAPAIQTAANNFLANSSSSLYAYNMSFSSVSILFSEVAQGHPVIVWTSGDYSTPDVSYTDITLSNGKIFSWPSTEHCVVLCGYDLNSQTVTFADPMLGIVSRPLEQFSDYYAKYFCQAVVIK